MLFEMNGDVLCVFEWGCNSLVDSIVIKCNCNNCHTYNSSATLCVCVGHLGSVHKWEWAHICHQDIIILY